MAASIEQGSRIYNGTICYTVQSVLGQGSYGKVVQCLRSDNCQTVALKIIENNSMERRLSAVAEIVILNRLKKLNVPQANWVKWDTYFKFNGLVCLEYEQLDKSLVDRLPEENAGHFDLPTVRAVIQQVAKALYYFKAAGVVHGDLKPGNVMLVNQESQPYRVNVIDFGLAHHVSQAKVGRLFGTRPFMAPELFLGSPYDASIDVWSLGCMAASLFTGMPYLYPGWDDYEMLWCIERSLGKLPQHVITPGIAFRDYYTRDGGASSSTWRLKTPQEYYGGQAGMREACRRVSSLDNFLDVTLTGPPIELMAMATDIGLFKDLVKGMLQPDPACRLTPIQILQHPFITMGHVMLQDYRSCYVRSCYQSMAVCYQQTKPPAAETSSTSFSEQPSNVQQTLPPPSVQKLSERPASPSRRANPPPAGTESKAAAGVQGCRGGDAPRRKRRSPERDRDRSRSPHSRRKRRSPERDRDRSRSPHSQRTSSKRQITSGVEGQRPGCAGTRPRPSPDQRASSRRQPIQRVNEGSPKRVRRRDRSRSPHSRRTSERQIASGVEGQQPGCARTRPRPSPDQRAPSRRQPIQRVNEGSPKRVCCRDRSRSPHNWRTSERQIASGEKGRRPGCAGTWPRP